MFAVTERLLLRPGWMEDAPALARAIADKRIVRNLATAPWPYRLEDAEEFLSTERDFRFPTFQIIDRTVDPVRLIGGIGFQEQGGAAELGYWLAPEAWGRGYAAEAGKAAIEAVRVSLGHRHFVAGHFIDNPASGRVLRKLGFEPTGRVEPRLSLARGEEVDSVLFELTFGEECAAEEQMEDALAA